MKTRIFSALLVIAALCLVSSCSDKDEPVMDSFQEDTAVDEDAPDGDISDDGEEPDGDGNPLVDGLIVLEGERFSRYTNSQTYPDDDPMFPEEEQHDVTSIPTAVTGVHTGYTSAYLRSMTPDYLRVDKPTTLSIYDMGDGAARFVVESYRWDMCVNSSVWMGDPQILSLQVTANPDETVYSFETGADDDHSVYASMPNWGASAYGGKFDIYTVEDVISGWKVSEMNGKISADGEKYDFFVKFYNIASGVNFKFRSGEPSPAECMAGHYHGSVKFENRWLSGTAGTQGSLANPFNDRSEMYALLKPEASDGELRLDIMGFDIGGNKFGNLNFTGITDVYDRGNWAYYFSLPDFSIETPVNNIWATITGSLEGEMTYDGKLTVVISAEYPSIGETVITFTGEWNDWLKWNAFYGDQTRRPW